MGFEFATATQIIFGLGSFSSASETIAEMGRRALLVTRPSCEQAGSLGRTLANRDLEVFTFCVDQEPTIEAISEGVELARTNACDLVIGIGGGSVIDSGKAIAILSKNEGEPLDYLEVIGHGKPLRQTSIPFVAIPTTAGTGAEVTRNAVLGSPEHRVKVSLRSPAMLPRLAIVDPELTFDLPPALTASTGCDALTQVMEPFVSHQANPLTDAFCREGMRRAARSLHIAYVNGRDVAAREDMALASLFGGLALANAKLGAVHGFAGPFGGMFPAPHGATCAALLPHAMAINVQALRLREPDNPALDRFDEVAAILTGDPNACAEDGIGWVEQLCRELAIPSLSEYGLTEDDFPSVIDKASRASSMNGNPIKLTDDELTKIVARAL